MSSHDRFARHTRTAHIVLNTKCCQACWACVETCPEHVIGKVDMLFHRHARIDHPENCRGCLRCLKACPSLAIQVRQKSHEPAAR